MFRRTPPTLQELRRAPVFGGLSRRELVAVDRLATPVEVPAGTILAEEGAPGAEFFVVLDGRVDVRHDDDVVATRGAGTHYGHIALLTRRPLTATLVTTAPTRLAVFGRREFRALADVSPLLAERLAVVGTVEHVPTDVAERLAA